MKSLIEVAAGESFELRQLAFYVGVAAMLMLIGAIPGLITDEFLQGLIGRNGRNRQVAAASGFLVTLIFPVAGVLFGVAFDYEDTDNIGRNIFAVIGVLAVSISVWLWRRSEGDEKGSTPS